jgi:hypothetical protein
MAATASIDHLEVDHSPDKEKILHTINNAASHIQTPPASDGSSHGHKDDDAASSSSLSDLEDDMEPDTRFEDDTAGTGTGTGTGVQEDGRSDIKPDRYEGGIPIFTPVRGSSSSYNSKHFIQSTPPLPLLCRLGVVAYLMLTCLITQTMEQFKDFEGYVKGVNSYGMQSGIVLIDPPEEW